jgi:lipopolysaccharide biosynthesis glycosyltransferase
MNAKKKNCLVTISDSEFCIASEVLLYSFLKYNPEFDGDILIITDDPDTDFRARLAAIFPVRFITPDPRLQAAVDLLQSHEPRLTDIYRRLFSLELFRLTGYERVVYLDSDIYCSGDISELFTRPEPLLACPDGFTFGDRIRAMLSEEENPTPSERYGKPYTQTFNAGVLSIGQALLNSDTYLQLLGVLDPAHWQGLGQSKFTDQMALNVFFNGQFTPIHSRFNYVIFLEEYQKCVENVSLLDARLVHFAGDIKPWNQYPPERLARRAPQFIKFIDIWRELLDEARHPVDVASSRTRVEERFHRQREWIEGYNQNAIEPTGRLY